MSDNIEKRLVGLFVLMLAVVGGAHAAINALRGFEDDSKWVNQVHDVIAKTDVIATDLHVGDTALTSYVLTGDARDQTAYRTAYNAMLFALEEAKAYTRADKSEQGPRDEFAKMEKLIKEHLSVPKELVQARDKGGIEAARKVLQDHPIADTTAPIDELVKDIKELERSHLTQRNREEVTQANNTKNIIYVGIGMNFSLLLIVSVLIRDDLKHRRVAALALLEANAQLEAKVQERTAELVKTVHDLKKENLERRWSYQALDHQLRYNELIVNASSEMVFVISKALNVSRVNPAVTHITQWQPQELITESVERVLQIPKDHLGNSIINALNEGHELQDRPAEVRTKGGTISPVIFNLMPLRDGNKIVGGVITARVVPQAAQKQA